jgi:hypothetical protein
MSAKTLVFGIVLGVLLGGLTARGALTTHIVPPAPQIIREIIHDAAPAAAPAQIKLDSVIRLYAPDGHAIKEYTGNFTGIEQSAGEIKFKLESGRTVILGGSFSVEEIPHQE